MTVHGLPLRAALADFSAAIQGRPCGVEGSSDRQEHLAWLAPPTGWSESPGRPRVRRGLLRGAVAAPMVVIRIGLALHWSPRIGVILSQVHGHLAGM